MKTNIKTAKRETRKKRIRAKVSGTAERPRLSVFKSNRYISAQLINDDKGVTIVSFSSISLKGKKDTKVSAAEVVGSEIAKSAKTKGVKKVVFDRGGYIYTGQIKQVADAARAGGLEF